jgi:DNA repair exonuclease SbcCD ATPase subunit
MALNEESRLLSMRILQNFVREKKGKWGQQDWSKLMQRIRKAGFSKTDEARIRKLMENNRERWLSGDNSVGPPPPGAKPAAKAAPGQKKEKEKPAMPEQPKPQPRRPEPPRPAAPKPAAPKPAAPTAARPGPKAPGGPSAVRSAPTLSSKEEKVSDTEAQEKHTRRLALLKRSQDLTKESMETEIEIRKQEVQQGELQRDLDRLEGQRDPLEQQKTTLQGEVDEATKDISNLQSSIEQLTTQRANLEESVGKRKKERSEHVAAIAHFKAEKEGLIT